MVVKSLTDKNMYGSEDIGSRDEVWLCIEKGEYHQDVTRRNQYIKRFFRWLSHLWFDLTVKVTISIDGFDVKRVNNNRHLILNKRRNSDE